jgi:hypothetical protein
MVFPDGTVPLVGDDDGGRLMRLDGLSPRDARPTLATGATLLGAAVLRPAGADAAEESLWLLGAEGASAPTTPEPGRATMRSRGFPEGGLYVLRDRLEGWWALADGGPHGALNCGHAHADALHLEVALDGRPLLTDSGTFSYTGQGREDFRATASHNTVTVDGESSSLTRGLFHWRHVARTTTDAWLSLPGADVWRGSHDGYARLADPAVHQRTVLLLHRRYLVVLDVLVASGTHHWTVHWHWASGLHAQRRDGASYVQALDGFRPDATLLQLAALGDGSLTLGRSWRSNAYGVKCEAPSTEYRAFGRGRQTAITLLVSGAAQLRATEGQNRAEIAGTGFRDTIVRRGSADRIIIADVETDADCAVLEANAAEEPERVILLGATYARLPGMDRQEIVRGVPFAARCELGRWRPEPFKAGLTGQRG